MNDQQKSTPVELIATYTELTFFDKRWFTLYVDRLHIRRKISNGTEVEATLHLDRLNPEYGRGKQKSPWFGRAMWLFMFGVILHLVTTGPSTQLWSKPLPPIGGLALACLFGGIGGLLANFRSIEFCQFANRDGIVVLYLRRLGRDVAKHEEFLAVLVKQIREARQKTDAQGDHTR